MQKNKLTALSVLDGRYAGAVDGLREIFSEYGLVRHRVVVEMQWLKFLIREPGIANISLTDAELKKLDSIVSDFDVESAVRVKEIEKTTNHDVKAVEYYIKERLDALGLDSLKEWVHFACTSEDISNTAYALMIKKGRDVVVRAMTGLLKKIEDMAAEHKAAPMMSRTHGQPASPTTAGKEFVNFAWRIGRELNNLRRVDIGAKMNGAVGNYNAHLFVFPGVDWMGASERFLSQYLSLSAFPYTPQINQYGYIAEILHSMTRSASMIIDMDRDMWGYISFDYFKQRLKKGEVGSSTMPHKVNPIDFENSEGNMGMALAVMEHMSVKLLQSRFQRDLSDSTVLRNLGAAFGYFCIGVKSASKGLNKLEINGEVMKRDLRENPELLAEPIQTAMRVFGEENPYERLKALTRGKRITGGEINAFVDSLEKTPDEVKERMKNLTPATYTGLAEALVDKYLAETAPSRLRI